MGLLVAYFVASTTLMLRLPAARLRHRCAEHYAPLLHSLSTAPQVFSLPPWPPLEQPEPWQVAPLTSSTVTTTTSKTIKNRDGIDLRHAALPLPSVSEIGPLCLIGREC